MIERGVVLCQGPVLSLDDGFFPVLASGVGTVPSVTHAPDPGLPLTRPAASESPPLEAVERRYIESVLEQTGGVIEGQKGAARILGLHPNTLRSRLKKLGILRPSHEIS